MALINCPDCGTQISDLAAACPSCARPVKKRKKPWGAVSFSGLVFGLVLLALNFNGVVFFLPFDTLVLGGLCCFAALKMSNLARTIFLGILAASTIFFHIVNVGGFITIIPKASFTFADTFISLQEITERYNKQLLLDMLHGNAQLDHLTHVLVERGYIKMRRRTGSEIEELFNPSLPDR